MQEIKKRSIVLASVLKPADDTRMLEKMAASLASTDKWNVHVIGTGVQKPPVPKVTFHLLGVFSRISFMRIIAPWRVCVMLFKIRPAKVIVTTHELLFTALLCKMLIGSQVFYDIQENYKLNILNTKAFPALVRPFFATFVRCVERLTSPFIDHFFLAEKTYSNELPFIGKKFTVLQNKAILPPRFKRNADPSKLKLIFTGTLDSTTGIFEAIELSKKLNEKAQNFSLTIIGFAASQKVREEIHALTNQHSFIQIIGIDQPVPHSQIIEAIGEANAGIIYYPTAIHTANRIPTKLYEYLAAQLPILYDTNASWRALPDQCQAGVAIDFASPNAQGILNALTSVRFYPQAPQDVFWKTEADSLIRALA